MASQGVFAVKGVMKMPGLYTLASASRGHACNYDRSGCMLLSIQPEQVID